MNYDKLTVERFKERLEAGDYSGLTGARRAIGKAGWTNKEKDRARALAEAHFGESGGAKAKPAAKPAGEKSGKKRAGGGTPKKAAARRGRGAKADVTPAPPIALAEPGHPREVAMSAPQPTQPAQHALEDATRANAAAMVIQALRGTGPMSQLEHQTYVIANAEYQASARDVARHAVHVAHHGVPVPQPLESDAGAAPSLTRGEHVNVPPGTPPRIATPPENGTAVPLTPEQQAQFERMQRSEATLPAILGQGTPPTTS